MNKIFSPEQLILPLHARIKPPILIILGSPRLVAQIAGSLNSPVSVFQLDLFQSEQIKNSLNALGRTEDKIICQSDLWDLSPQYQTILFPIAAHGERELKIKGHMPRTSEKAASKQVKIPDPVKKLAARTVLAIAGPRLLLGYLSRMSPKLTECAGELLSGATIYPLLSSSSSSYGFLTGLLG